MAKTLRITQIKSLIGRPPKHRRTMEALGFHRIRETLEKADTPQIRGMINQVKHLIKVEEDEKA